MRTDRMMTIVLAAVMAIAPTMAAWYDTTPYSPYPMRYQAGPCQPEHPWVPRDPRCEVWGRMAMAMAMYETPKRGLARPQPRWPHVPYWQFRTRPGGQVDPWAYVRPVYRPGQQYDQFRQTR